MQNGTKIKELSETGEIEIYDIDEDEQVEAEKAADDLIEELGELNDTEKGILKRMHEARKTTGPDTLSLDGSPATNWTTIVIGQDVEIAGLLFRVSHISQGFIILEANKSRANEPESSESMATVWTHLQCTGARSLIRIDGTPLFVETRILTGAEKEEKDVDEEE